MCILCDLRDSNLPPETMEKVNAMAQAITIAEELIEEVEKTRMSLKVRELINSFLDTSEIFLAPPKVDPAVEKLINSIAAVAFIQKCKDETIEETIARFIRESKPTKPH